MKKTKITTKKTRLRRICKNCDEYFFPTGKYEWVCIKCLKKINKERIRKYKEKLK